MSCSSPRALHLFAALALPVLAACSEATEEGESTPSRSASTERDDTHFDVKWKPATVVVDEAAAAKAWLPSESAPADGRYVFNDTAALQPLAANTTVVLPKIGLFKIVSVERSGGKVVLETEPGSLLDAATEGAISWNIPVTAHAGMVGLQPDPGAGAGDTGNLGARSIKPLADAVVPKDAIDFHASGDGYTFGVKMSRTDAAGKSSFAFDIMGSVETEEEGMTTSAAVGLKGTIAFRARGSYEFKDKKVVHFDFRATEIDLDATASLDIQSLTVRGELIDYPARIIVPFAVGPIPLYYAFGGAVEMNADLGLKQAVKANGTVKYTGDIGIEGSGFSVTKMTKTGKPVFTGKIDPSMTLSASAIATLAAPRIELGMGVPQLGKLGVSAGLFVDMRASLAAKFTTGSSGTCLEGLGALGAYYGGEAKFFGLSLGTEAPIVKFSDMTVGTESCPDE